MKNHSEKSDKKEKKGSVFSNFGDGPQIYDVCFEVDRLDAIARKEGKASDAYNTQHEAAVKRITHFNNAVKSDFPLSLGKCREIIQSSLADTDTVFFNEGKTVASNKNEGKTNK